MTLTAGTITGVAGTETFDNVDNTIVGTGTISNLALLDNSGTIEALGGTLQINGGSVTNTGTLEAHGGSLDLESVSVTNTGGTVQVDTAAGSTLNLGRRSSPAAS